MQKISLYIHFPFCESKCPYCDFNSHVADDHQVDRMLQAYQTELRFYQDYLRDKEVSTIFFGGGTPSLMPPKLVEGILSSINNIADNAEITMEANPSSAEAKNFKDYASLGVNRLSIGVQSFDDDALKFLGRRHNAAEARAAIDIALSAVDNFSFDMIYALPDQQVVDWQKQLDIALSYGAPHLSAYQLTIEKGTPFYAQYHKDKAFSLPQDELARDLYLVTESRLADAGLQRYEISNYSIPGKESQHNLAYWHYDDYLGIGAGAHSRITNKNGQHIAMMNIHDPNKWMSTAIENNGNARMHNDVLANEVAFEEYLMMNMRLLKPIYFKMLSDKFNAKIDINILESLEPENYIDLTEDYFKLSTNGHLVLSSITSRLLTF